jgi:hypothetical protein
MLSQKSAQQFEDYQKRWLPIQDHLSSVVTSMNDPDSWQNKEAEGKAAADVASAFEKADQQRTAATLSHGIDVGSSKFKLATAGSAAAEAETKGMEINSAHDVITKSYLSGLQSISQAGQKLASGAAGGSAVAGEVASREQLSSAQADQSKSAGIYAAVGTGIGAIGGAMTGGGKPDAPDAPSSTTNGNLNGNASLIDANPSAGLNLDQMNSGYGRF